MVRLALVMLLWAICFPLIAIGLTMAPPLTFAALRSFIAGACLLIPAYVWGHCPLRGWRVWLILLAIGISITSIGFAGMFLAGGLVSPGIATVLSNSQPFIAAGLAFLVLGERLGPRLRVGMLLGFAGILLVALPGFNGDGTNSTLSGVSYILLAAIGVAIGNVLLKRLAGQVDTMMALGWQFVLGGIPLLVAARFYETPDISWSVYFVVVLLALGLLGTAVSYVLWFSLLQQGELNRLNIFTFLTPVFALLIGAAFFNERMQWSEVIGTLLILASVWWINHQ